MSRRHILPVLLVLVAGTSLAAQDSKQAVAEFKSGAKTALKAYKTAVATAGETLDNAIDIFELQFEVLATELDPLDDLVGAAQAYQAQVKAARTTLADALGDAAESALQDVPQGGPDEDVLPKAFLCGGDGVVDDVAEDAAKLTAKACAVVNKKLAKVAAKLRKQTDMRLSFRLEPIVAVVVAPEAAFSFLVEERSLTLDLVAVFNRGGAASDGVLRVGGLASFSSVPVTIESHGPLDPTDEVPPDLATSRWLAALGALPEGNYLITAEQEDGSRVADVFSVP